MSRSSPPDLRRRRRAGLVIDDDHELFSGLGIPAMILALFGLMFMMIGILGAYVAQIHDEVRNRPNYIIRQTIGFDPPLLENDHYGGLVNRSNSCNGDGKPVRKEQG